MANQPSSFLFFRNQQDRKILELLEGRRLLLQVLLSPRRQTPSSSKEEEKEKEEERKILDSRSGVARQYSLEQSFREKRGVERTRRNGTNEAPLH